MKKGLLKKISLILLVLSASELFAETQTKNLEEPVSLSLDYQLHFKENVDQLVLNGNGFNVTFPLGGQKLVTLPENCDIILKDCNLLNFNPKNVELGNGSKLFLHDVLIALADDWVVDTPDQIIISGDVRCCGDRNNLSMICKDGFEVKEGGNLYLENIVLEIEDPNCFKVGPDRKGGVLSLYETKVLLDSSGWNWEGGQIFISGFVQVSVFDEVEAGSSARIFYNSSDPLIIGNGGYFKMLPRSCLDFASNDSISTLKLQLLDASSTLHLDRSAINLGSNMLVLGQGRVIVENLSTICDSTKGAGTLVVEDSCIVKVLNKGNLKIVDVGLDIRG